MEPETDPNFSTLEETLCRYSAAPLPDPLRRLLESTALQPSSLADLFLAAWTTAGALAACVVAILTAWQLLNAPVPVTPTRQEIAQRQQMVIENQKIIASR